MQHGVRKILVKVEYFDTWKFYSHHFLFFSTTYPCFILQLQTQLLIKTVSHNSQVRVECNITIPKQRHGIHSYKVTYFQLFKYPHKKIIYNI